MPLFVNENSIVELSNLTGIDVEKLKSELVVDAAAAPTESKIKDLLKETVIYKKKDHDTLLDNIRKEKYDEGKYKETNQIVKLALGDKAFDTKDMKREDVFAKLQTSLKADWEIENGKVPDVRVKTLEEEKGKLQKLVEEKDGLLQKAIAENESTKTTSTKREKVLEAVSSINFEAIDKTILSKQREVVMKNIISSYTLKIEDGKDVWYDSNGKKLTDSLQNPLSIDEIAKGEAIIFPISEASNGRGENSSKNSNNNSSGNIDAELKKAVTMDNLTKLMTAKGLSAISSEGKAVIRKWSQIHNAKA